MFRLVKKSLSNFHLDNLVIHADIPASPADVEEYRPAGMEALEILHNQLQLLVRMLGMLTV